MSDLDTAVEFYKDEHSGLEEYKNALAAAAELARLRASEAAARAFVAADGRDNPPALYAALKELLERKP